MFGHSNKALRKSVEHTLHWADKVYNYRKDLLTQAQCRNLQQAKVELLGLYKSWPKKAPVPTKLQDVLKQLQSQLRVCGGKLYPVSFWCDNAEVFWVAAFLAIGIRSFFFQPFRIPTCSMFPSFSGMQTCLHENSKERPNWWNKPFRWLTIGAENYYYKAPCDGFVKIPLFNRQEMLRYNSHVRYEIETGREVGNLWFKHFFPKPYKVYLLWIGDQQVRIRVPFEFTDMEAVLRKKFFPNYKSFDQLLRSENVDISYKREQGYFVKTSNYAKKGECFLHFDICAGDMLFVDRLTYHFRRPNIGEAIVFRTGNIPLLDKDLYYIKRLVGCSGDLLSIEKGKLLRNRYPMSECSAFINNNLQKGLYPGYCAQGFLEKGREFIVNSGFFFVLGDNSPFSYDSRFWGEVPKKDVIGKAAFVIHPFSWRWGFADKDKANEKAFREDYVFQ